MKGWVYVGEDTWDGALFWYYPEETSSKGLYSFHSREFGKEKIHINVHKDVGSTFGGKFVLSMYFQDFLNPTLEELAMFQLESGVPVEIIKDLLRMIEERKDEL